MITISTPFACARFDSRSHIVSAKRNYAVKILVLIESAINVTIGRLTRERNTNEMIKDSSCLICHSSNVSIPLDLAFIVFVACAATRIHSHLSPFSVCVCVGFFVVLVKL